MTFVLGMRCDDGLVLCSDSLESDGYTRKNVQKLFKYEVKGKWGLAFGCSASTAACTNFGDRFLELIDDKQDYDRRGTEKLIEATMSYMRSQYPNEPLNAIVGLWCVSPSEMRLYKASTENQCLSVESDYACAGLDVSLARFLLDSVFTGASGANVMDGSHLGVFVTAIMKEKADGVGGPTQLLHYHLGAPSWCDFPEDSVASMEKSRYFEGPFSLKSLEKNIRQFFWSRFPHEFREAKD